MDSTVESTRLNKAISDTGYCSRREADKLIEQGKVKINGRLGVLGDRVFPDDEVTINDKVIDRRKRSIYIAYHKPVGITCTTETYIPGNIITAINFPERIFPIGRLDKPSEGLIFLTSDGNIVNKILRAGNNHEKEYLVTVNKSIDADFIAKMGNGIPMLGTVTKKCSVEKISDRTFKIILTQGLNRQIRRMCDFLGYDVTRLIRTRIMNITLEGIKQGEWRYFSEKELNEILLLSSSSIKTEEASKQSENENEENDLE